MRIYPIFQRVVQVIGGGDVDVLARSRPATRARNVIDLLVGTPSRAGTQLRNGPTSVTMPAQPAATAATHAAGDTFNDVAAGARARTISQSDFRAVDGEPGVKLGRLRVDLTRRSGADDVTQSNYNGRSDWTEQGNVVGDTPNQASIAGNVAGARGGMLRLTYPSWTGKDDLTITRCELHYYGRQDGTVLNNGDFRYIHLIDGVQTNDRTITNDQNHTATPFVVDLSSEVSALSDLDSLEVRVAFGSGIGETQSAAFARAVVVVEAEWETTP